VGGSEPRNDAHHSDVDQPHHIGVGAQGETARALVAVDPILIMSMVLPR
jgi:hypothetical protein